MEQYRFPRWPFLPVLSKISRQNGGFYYTIIYIYILCFNSLHVFWSCFVHVSLHRGVMMAYMNSVVQSNFI